MSRLTCACAILMVATASAAGQQGERPKTDKELIQGTWEVISALEGGRKTTEADGLRIIITAGMLTVRPKNAQGEKDTLGLSYTLDPTQQPRAIDTSHELEPGKPFIDLGVYSLDGDTLKLCLAAAGKPRPTTLESKAGDSSNSFVLKRVK
jgi:uncharacterized protein (TIGR03067 family)